MSEGRWTRRALLAVLVAGVAGSCGDDGVDPNAACGLVALPLSASANGPTVTDVALEVQEGDGIVVLMTATDPQGSDDLFDVVQTVRLFPDARCEGTPITLQDDLAGSGVEESFGTAVEAGTPLFASIAAAATWPVEVDVRDGGGNRVTGRVAARVVR